MSRKEKLNDSDLISSSDWNHEPCTWQHFKEVNNCMSEDEFEELNNALIKNDVGYVGGGAFALTEIYRIKELTNLVVYYKHGGDGHWYNECFVNVTEWKPEAFEDIFGHKVSSWKFF